MDGLEADQRLVGREKMPGNDKVGLSLSLSLRVCVLCCYVCVTNSSVVNWRFLLHFRIHGNVKKMLVGP